MAPKSYRVTHMKYFTMTNANGMKKEYFWNSNPKEQRLNSLCGYNCCMVPVVYKLFLLIFDSYMVYVKSQNVYYRIVPSRRPPPNFDSFVVFHGSPCNRTTMLNSRVVNLKVGPLSSPSCDCSDAPWAP